MAIKKDLSFGATDQATGESIGGKYSGQANGLVNSYSVTTQDAATTAITGFASGEAPATLSPPVTFSMSDPATAAAIPSWIRVLATAGASVINLPLHPYDGMTVTVTDIDGGAPSHNIQVGGSAGALIENPASPGSYVGPYVNIANAGGSITWRCATGSPNKWIITAKF
jgi:hypothetical protein